MTDTHMDPDAPPAGVDPAEWESFVADHEYDALVEVFNAADDALWKRADALLHHVGPDPVRPERADSGQLKKAQEALAAAGHPHSTEYLGRLRSVAQAFSPEAREYSLPFSHYRRVTQKVTSQADRKGWLVLAEEKRWTATELESQINTEKIAAGLAGRAPAPTPAPAPVTPEAAEGADGPVITHEGVVGGEADAEPEDVPAPSGPVIVDVDTARAFVEANPEAFGRAVEDNPTASAESFAARSEKAAASALPAGPSMSGALGVILSQVEAAFSRLADKARDGMDNSRSRVLTLTDAQKANDAHIAREVAAKARVLADELDAFADEFDSR